MKFKVEFNCDNAAFDEDSMNSEIARLLTEVADKTVNGWMSGSIRDINGNGVGSFELEED